MTFWDNEWNNSNEDYGADLISHVMQKEAVDDSYAFLGDIKGKRILDVGCGSGAQTLLFLRGGGT